MNNSDDSESHVINVNYIRYNDDRDESQKFYEGVYLKPYSGENREECNICLDNDAFTYKSWVKLGALIIFIDTVLIYG